VASRRAAAEASRAAFALRNRLRSLLAALKATELLVRSYAYIHTHLFHMHMSSVSIHAHKYTHQNIDIFTAQPAAQSTRCSQGDRTAGKEYIYIDIYRYRYR